MPRCLLAGSFVVVAMLAGCHRPNLRPGTGGLRVRVLRLPAGASANVWIARAFEQGRPWHAIHLPVRDGEALFLDLEPESYRVSVVDSLGGAGFYETFGGHDSVIVRSGEIARAGVTINPGIAVRGRVIDAQTHAPLGDTQVTPPQRTGGAWPVALPSPWTATDANGDFVVGALVTRTTGLWFSHDGYQERSMIPEPAEAGPWVVALERLPQ